MSDDEYEYFDLDAALIFDWMMDQSKEIEEKHKRLPTDEEWKVVQMEAQRRWDVVQSARSEDD